MAEAEEPLEQIEAAIASLEAQRGLLGDAVVATAVASLQEKLAIRRQRDAATQELKTATVLFMDIVGSTRLSERLDPEDVHAVMDSALERLTAIVRHHHGRVLQYAGDSLLAVFGADQALEDDAERAVRAGLAIVAEATPLSADFSERYHLREFALRVGIHTGPVLLGGGVNADGSIRGVTVNIAARMEQTAPAGALRISHETYRHVRGIFDVEPQARIEIKGITGTVNSYLVLRARPREFRVASPGLEGIQTQMVGREVELAGIEEAFQATCANKAAMVITVAGEPGIGKSRLSAEFLRRLERLPARALVFCGRSQAYGTHVPYGLLRHVVAWAFGIGDSDSQALAKDKLAAGLGPILNLRAPEATAFIGQLIGLDYGADAHIKDIADASKQIRDRAFHLLAVYFRQLHGTSGNPIVLLLDDLHWADDGSLDFFEHLAKSCSDLPLFVLCTTRPTLYERRTEWGSGESSAQRIDLAPLSEATVRQLVSALLARLGSVPQALADLLTSTAEGNPFFVEELVAMLMDDGVITTDAEPWAVAEDKLSEVRLPSTLAGVLQARIDALTSIEKLTLQRASVVGHVFWDEALQDIAPSVTGPLDSLTRRELTYDRDTSAFQGTRELVFKHHVLHQVVYQGVLKHVRREQHRLTANWLVVRSGDRASEYHGVIAEHYERAGDHLNAVTYLRKAGEDAARGYANQAALNYLGRAVALTRRDDCKTLFELLSERARVFSNTGQRTEEEADVRALEQLAEDMNDDAARARAASTRSLLALVTDDFSGAIGAAQRAVGWAKAAGTPDSALVAQTCWGQALRFQADYENAHLQTTRALDLARQCRNRRAEGNMLLQLGILTNQQGRLASSRQYFRDAREMARATGDRATEAGATNALASDEMTFGNYEAAIELFQAGRSICAEIGLRRGEAIVLTNLSQISLDCGAPAKSLEYIEQADVIATAIRDRNVRAVLLNHRGNALTALGDWAGAERCYGESIAMFRELGRPSMPPEPIAGLAQLALKRGDLAGAMASVTEILNHLDGGGSLSGTTDASGIVFTCYEVLFAAGDARASEFLKLAHDDLMESAAHLDEDARSVLLKNVPRNRSIVAAWAIARL